MIQPNKRNGITLYISETVSLEIHLKYVHRHVWDGGEGGGQTTPTSPGDSLTTAMHVLPVMLQYH